MQMEVLLVVLVLLLRQELAVSQTPCVPPKGRPGCVCKTDQGIIDLTSLANTNGKPRFEGITDPYRGDYTYSYNPCSGFKDPEGPCSELTVSACQESTDRQYALGDIKQEVMYTDSTTGNVYLQYDGGQDGRSTVVNLYCSSDTSITADGDHDTQLTYVFHLSTPCACPGGCHSAAPPSGTGSKGARGQDISGYIGIILMMLAFSGLVTYFIVGSIVNYVMFEKRGIDIIPQKNIWFSIPFLVKDGVLFMISPCMSKIRHGSGQYEKL